MTRGVITWESGSRFGQLPRPFFKTYEEAIQCTSMSEVEISEEIREFWRRFRAAQAVLDRFPEIPPEAWAYAGSPAGADELARLTVVGMKTATSSLYWIYEYFKSAKLPTVGDTSIIIDSASRPLCVITTMKVDILPFEQVGEAHAYAEGEGDRSLRYWREGHWDFFSHECRKIGREPARDMPVVCERFHVIYTNAST